MSLVTVFDKLKYPLEKVSSAFVSVHTFPPDPVLLCETPGLLCFSWFPHLRYKAHCKKYFCLIKLSQTESHHKAKRWSVCVFSTENLIEPKVCLSHLFSYVCVPGPVIPRLCCRGRIAGTPGNRGKLKFIHLTIHTPTFSLVCNNA